MGRTFKRNDRWKKDRRDKNFQKSKKFKEAQHDKHSNKPMVVNEDDDLPPPIEIEEDYDSMDNNL